ncbi:Serine/threonine-protein kinase ppk35 [Leucoagaricus sp. SymC.cos]|nr:Serine/threonine-protein kinase ppk35 [Leucoagaricus sp. SymC.cos]
MQCYLTTLYPLVQKLLCHRANPLRWSFSNTHNSPACSEASTDSTPASITVSVIGDDTPASSDTPSTDDFTKLNVLLESSSGSFIDVPITPPTSPADVLTTFAYTLSPATPASPMSPFLSPSSPHTPVSSEGSTLVTEDSEEKLKSASVVSTLKRRQPLAELPIPEIQIKLRNKPKLKSESSPPLLKTPECKIQTSSSTGKENRPPSKIQKPPKQNPQTKGAYYRKDTFMSALKMDMIPVGEGGFGQVFRATAIGERTIAVKLMQRGTVTQEIAIVNEVQALRTAKGCKWAVELIYFQAAQEQALIALTYLPGGDMHSYWERSGFCLDFSTAQFYTAQLILAIHDLHTRGIIHRDIKLENMMLDPQRNLKLVDFGLAQIFNHPSVSEKDFPLFYQMSKLGGDAFPLLWATSHNPHQTDLANGTEGYAPPEVWKCQPHSFGIDYFAMGCVLHMLITGNAPFEFNQVTQDYTYDNISVDKTMDVDAFDFLTKVLSPKPMNRLNVRRMKLHPVFRGIDWNALAAGTIEAPPYPRGQ